MDLSDYYQAGYVMDGQPSSGFTLTMDSAGLSQEQAYAIGLAATEIVGPNMGSVGTPRLDTVTHFSFTGTPVPAPEE